MDEKSFLTILIIYVVLDSIKNVGLSNMWILNQLIKLIICFTVFYIFSFIWNFITKEKFKKFKSFI